MPSPIVEFLKTVELLAGIEDDDLIRLASTIEMKTFKAGQTVLFKGEAVDGLHVVRDGTVEIWAKPPKEKETKKVAELPSPLFFGETSILEETVAGATVKGGAKGAQIFVIPQQAFLDLIQARPDLKAKLEALIASRRPAPPAPRG